MTYSRPPRTRLAAPARGALGWALTGLAVLPLSALAQEGLQLKPQHTLIDPNSHPKEEVPKFGIADEISGQEDVDAVLTGHAELRQANENIKADTIHYFQVEDEMLATGSVRLYQHGDVYVGPELHLHLDDDHGYFIAPTYSFGTQGSRGYADRINFFDRTHSELIEAVYTTCPPGDYEWYLTADVMRLDEDINEGAGTNSVLYFEGVPILASPYLTFPLSNERKSGFLPPTLSLVSTNGWEFILPYYWNIAPNYDMTIVPNYMSKRGLQLGADLRYLDPNNNGYLRYEAIDDNETQTFRYSEAFVDYWHGTGALAGFSGVLNYSKVSDPYYFNDFSRTFAAASTRTLPRDAEVSYGSTYWTATLRTLSYQTLEQTGSFLTPPYNEVPQMLFHAARLDYGGFDLNLDAQFTRFTSPGLVDGDRWVFNPSVAYPIVGPGYFITPKVSYNTTTYSLTNVAAGQPDSITRNLPTVSLDSGVIFERDANLFGNDYLQTLEPRIFYVKRPYQNQSAIPNFDSGVPDDNFDQLFSENTFVGYDRLADENQVTAAVTTRLLNPQTGSEMFRAAIGERFYLSDQLVTLPGGTPVNAGQADFLAAISGRITPTLSIDTGLDYSSTVGGMERSNIGGTWQPEPLKQLTIEYRYLRGQFDQFDVSGQWPLWGNFYALGRVNYSARDKTLVQGFAGLEYKGCCYVLRFFAQHYATGLGTSSTSVFMQLELNGFSNIGSNPFDAIRKNVTGYQNIVPPPAAESMFNNYE
ncbi:MAG: LPS-assembly protein LptD [Burkholderiaceae bacterium]